MLLQVLYHYPKLKDPNLQMNVLLSHLKSKTSYYERDPGKRIPISQYPLDKQDEVRRAYIDMRPCQPIYEYPHVKFGAQNRRFQSTWFTQHPWLEFSVEKESAFCFPCYLFESNASQPETFTVKGFKNWKRVNCKDCPLKKHEGDGNSLHYIAMEKWENLRHPNQYIERRIHKQTEKEKKQNRLLLKTSIESVKWLALQGCAFRGHDESPESTNRGNYIELIKLHGRANKEIDDVVLENAAKNAKYTSPRIQKEILKIIADCVRHKIREEIGDAKFCILVDEAVDESHKEQMAIILRYVDGDGFVRERFFEVVSVKDTNALTLKKEICTVLTNTICWLQIYEVRGMMVLATCGENGVDCKHYFLENAHLLITFIVLLIVYS